MNINKNDLAKISERMIDLRTFSDYSTAEMAELLSIEEADYIDFESGKKEIPINLIYKFASIIDTEASYVMTGVLPSKEAVNVVYDGKGTTIKRYEGYSFISLANDFKNKTMNPLLVTLLPTETP